MYESYWQLRQKPFDNTFDPQFYFPGQSHQAALLKLRYAVENRCGGALLAGAPGIGKTLVVSMLRAALGETYSPFVRLVYPQMPADELLAYLADELDGTPRATQGSLHESIRRIEQALCENAAQGRQAVLVVDEAHLIESAETFEMLRLLLNFGGPSAPAASLVLAGQPGILPILQRLPPLEARLGVKCLLRAFTLSETADYVAHRLRAAGAVRSIIDPEALPALHELSHGVPRQINRLCDLALLIGFAEERQTLGAEQFEAVCRELVTVEPE